MEIYLDANATTPVLARARAAALAAMADDYGNPSSIHSSGLKARALVDGVRALARRVLGAPTGQLLFVSGATEGIQTAVLSALHALRRRPSPDGQPWLLLYGATEHKVVPESLRHWNELLGLDFEIQAIPVHSDGRHDLEWLKQRAPRAGLVCTMAANNESGVISDLSGIATALTDSPALWLVDGVQALGKLPLQLGALRIDYAAFSGHKLYAPKGIGLLYVREGAPFTPLLAGGGQEGARRSGTENMSGIAALGAVLATLEEGQRFKPLPVLQAYREQLSAALQAAFTGLCFNAPPAICLPTTLNFSVPGLSSKLLLDLFDAAEVRVSGGSACNASKAQPSHVLQAMGLPAWQADSAVRLSFGPAVNQLFIDDACARIRSCGEALRACCLGSHTDPLPLTDGVTRFEVDGACCYVVVDAASRQCVVIDPLPELFDHLLQWLSCQQAQVRAVLDTHSHADHESVAGTLREALMNPLAVDALPINSLGWPEGQTIIPLGARTLQRLPLPGHTQDSTAYLLRDTGSLRLAFVGDTVLPGALGRSDFERSAPLAYAGSLQLLAQTLGPDLLLLPAHDYDRRLATNLRTESAQQPLLSKVLNGQLDANGFAASKAVLERNLAPTVYQTLACGAPQPTQIESGPLELDPSELRAWLRQHPNAHWIDVREPYEQRLSAPQVLEPACPALNAPLSTLINHLPDWLPEQPPRPLLFVCRSGNRSLQAARALRRLGHEQAWSLSGGLALWAKLEHTSPSDEAALAI
ncbi:cysteine sulfinate desulfinase/cysteine desulfurase-like protein/rhodanese-related sulfurtransferase [Inhella inkyongensis]|uniref:cysteine desulfurase n=1 Tax=Inhella inkyongensis TaxID=392593 RepID=A0A840S5F7_9BURK|nr:aminotransferase class V-fold PLP-dependent enzyme [Inhella inkyongensis]MBB5204256.1 cysteine sulfinate desulfinase/cysteine desulfurase-like protein/rhodanese-related sulfurtransferase [Inhella inkyongensis]